MVDSNNNDVSDAQQPKDGDQEKQDLQAAFTEYDFSQANQPLDQDESAKLADFLTKVSKACKNDKSLPGFIGDQVNTWMAELKQEDKKDDAGDASATKE